MSRLLPAATTFAEFYRERSRPLTDWLPALQSIAALHCLTDGPAARFSRGECPVFSWGPQFVIKLLPALMEKRAQQETDLLTFLATCTVPRHRASSLKVSWRAGFTS